MEQVESIPFSSLIASMLLLKKSCTSAEIVNISSKLIGMGIMVDDENDDMGKLSCCVKMSEDYSCFHLKEGLEYDTIIYPNVTVFEFLNIYTNEKIMTFLKGGDVTSKDENLGVVMPLEEKEKNLFVNMKESFFEPKKRVRGFPFQKRLEKVNYRAIVG